MREQKHGWWNSIALKGGNKKLAIIVVRRMVDANAKGVKSFKVRCEISCGKAKRARQTREELLIELKNTLRRQILRML